MHNFLQDIKHRKIQTRRRNQLDICCMQKRKVTIWCLADRIYIRMHLTVNRYPWDKTYRHWIQDSCTFLQHRKHSLLQHELRMRVDIFLRHKECNCQPNKNKKTTVHQRTRNVRKKRVRSMIMIKVS